MNSDQKPKRRPLPRSRTSAPKPAKTGPGTEMHQATDEDFEREGLGVASKE